MLELVHLSKNFGGVMAVSDCDFEVPQGKITALIGPNGSGKSTIFNLISGLLKPNNGYILFNKKRISGLSPEKISNCGISRVFQQSRLFENLTVEENLLLALDSEDTKFWKNLFSKNKRNSIFQSKIDDILEKTKMKDFKYKKAGDLSFGQKRLIEISRAILNPHNLLILDEPVAGVTPSLREEIAQILIDLNKKGETIFLIEHDMLFTFKVADWIIVMDDGKVIAQGKPEEIKNDPKVLEAYFGE